MQQYKLKNLALLLNFFVIGIVAIQVTINILIEEVIHWDVWCMWYAFAITLILINYFLLTPYVFRKGFSLKRLLLLFLYNIILHFILSLTWTYCVVEFYLGFELKQGFTDFVTRFQVSFFYFMLSTSTRIIQMFSFNQVKIKDIEEEKKWNELKSIQSGIQTDLISNYISFLQNKINTESVSNEIVELADFLRYTTYSGEMNQNAFKTELEQLNLFASVVYKGGGLQIDVQNLVEDNPLIPVFSLLTPVKEILLKVNNLNSLKVVITRVSRDIVVTMFTLDKLPEDLQLYSSERVSTSVDVEFQSVIVL